MSEFDHIDFDKLIEEKKIYGGHDLIKDLMKAAIRADRERLLNNHPYPRDIFTEPTKEEWKEIVKAIQEAGFNETAVFCSMARRGYEAAIFNITGENLNKPIHMKENEQKLNSKQIEEDCRDMLFSELPIEEREHVYIFTPEELKAYKEALCREQREICAEAALQCSGVLLREQARRAIQNAEEP